MQLPVLVDGGRQKGHAVSLNLSIRGTFQLNVQVDAVVVEESLTGAMAAVQQRLEGARQPAQEAMADVFHGVVLANFGSIGFDRPHDWQPLSPKYAKRVGRQFATLYVTGALKGTVKKDAANVEAATVSMANSGDVPYALAHHHGNPPNFGWTAPGSGALPARRVFPLDPANDAVMERTKNLVVRAAQDAVKEELK